MAATGEEAHWIVQQKKTFTAWVDSQISIRGLKIPPPLDRAFEDGLYLIPLCEVVCKDKCLKYSKKPKMRVHKIENVNVAMTLLKTHGFVPDISNEMFVDCNAKMILGFIWQLFVHWTGGDKNKQSGDPLLEWVQSRVNGKDRYPGVAVSNFSANWMDGRVVAALLDSISPKIIDYSKQDLAQPAALWQGALDAAEDVLDVPRLLEADDMVANVPDDKCVKMYVTLIKNAYFANQAAIEDGSLFPSSEPAPAPVAVVAPAPSESSAAPVAAPPPVVVVAAPPRKKRKNPRDDVPREALIDALVSMLTDINDKLLRCPECNFDLTDWVEEHNCMVP